MAEIDWVRGNGWVRRMDPVTGGAMVLAVEAVAFLLIAVIGTPFLVFFVADDDASVSWLWPFAAVCATSAVLGAAAAVAAFLIGSRGTQRDRRAGVVAALAVAAATGVLTATSAASAPLLAMVSALLTVGNVAAATLLHTAEPIAELAEPVAPAVLPEVFLLAAPLAEAEVRTRETVEIEVRRPAAAARWTTARPRRPRGPAALHTLGGVRLPPRALRNRRR
ncbi:hypothetical protein ACTOB_002973 [Actinoplanes oblitus]|uniref:Uncharacterized protein n=1 Tax=Actinoplanes oblitus TaxID=3040509 RepID=A0ABY8WNV9_9ACTN|nr:hypothetical protein [Actinoplanes oblitus]WIM99323.1 hypothetical protein ACTOB_002973 [Actinoplanes oblitus]